MAKRRAAMVHGLFTAIITPFDGRGRVDVDAMADLVRFQISKGTEGIYACGTTGLAPMLSIEERESVAEAVIGASRGRVPVVVQVGCADTSSSMVLAKHAEEAGADAVASLTPYYYKPGDRAIVKHFETISASIALPLFAYNIPQFTGNNLLPQTVASMAEEGTISGIKDSSRDFLQLVDLIESVPDDFVVMNGTEEYGLFAIMSGANGLVSGGASALPELFKALVAAERDGDHGAAVAAQKKVQKVRELVRTGPISAYYAILRERGIECGAPRAPFLETEGAGTQRMFKGLKALHLL